MKRTISLIIAIAVMISMFVLPASAAEYDVDMTTINGAARFTIAESVTEWGITSDVVGLHYQTGEQEVNPNLANGNLVDITLDLSDVDTMVITYRNGLAVGAESSDVSLTNADHTVSYGTFDIKGTGNWGTTAEASIDVSDITAAMATYHLKIEDNAANGVWITGIKLVGDNVSGGGSTDPVTPPVGGNTVTAPSQFVAGTNALSQNIEGFVNLTSGTYVIDLAGYTWENLTSDQYALAVSGAHVTIIDSSAAKTGKLVSSVSDAIVVNNGTLILDGVTVIGAPISGDAVFVNGGTIVSQNSNLSAGKAGIDVTSPSASVTINGGSFPVYSGTPDERRCAIEFRNNASITLNGDINFEVSRVICRSGHTNSFDVSVVEGEYVTTSFTTPASFAQNTSYQYSDMTYTYSAPAGDPAFVDGAAISLTGGLTINFLAENITANEYVMVGDVRVDAEYKTAGEYAGYYVFAFGDFGPQEMGDDFTAELYSNGVVVDSMTYSVADYCYAVIEDSSSSPTLVKLAKATLNYGAAAQKYRNYKVNNLVNANLSDADQNPWYSPWAAEPTVGNDSSVHAQYLWHRANVHFADKLSLVVTFKADYAVEVTDAPDHVVCIWDINDRSQDQILDVTDLGNGEYQVTVTDILPTQYQLYFCFYVVAESGEQLTDELNFSISSYIELNDYYLEGENEDYGYYEPIGPINDLVRALSQYGDAAVAYVA